MKPYTALFLAATTASNIAMADTDNCVTKHSTPEDKKTFLSISDETNIKYCIKGKITPLENVVKNNKHYQITGGDQIHIFDADDGHGKGKLDLNWGAIQPEWSENYVSKNINKTAKNNFDLAVSTTCNHVKQNLEAVTSNVNKELSAYSEKYPYEGSKASPSKYKEFTNNTKARIKNLKQFTEEFCL